MVQKWSFVVALSFFACLSEDAHAQFSLFRSSPAIEEITTTELKQLLSQRAKQLQRAQATGGESPKADFILVDVRAPKEYQVSMIPGAITKAQFERDASAYSGATVIPYCTVGGRSLQYAKQLAANGTKVLNFDESIIGWCKAKLPLVRLDGSATNEVHTYSSRHRVPAEYKAIH